MGANRLSASNVHLERLPLRILAPKEIDRAAAADRISRAKVDKHSPRAWQCCARGAQRAEATIQGQVEARIAAEFVMLYFGPLGHAELLPALQIRTVPEDRMRPETVVVRADIGEAVGLERLPRDVVR